LPNEEEYINSVIETFTTQCEDSGNPEDLSAAATPKNRVLCEANSSSATIFRRNFDTASMPNRKRFAAGFSGELRASGSA